MVLSGLKEAESIQAKGSSIATDMIPIIMVNIILTISFFLL
ncbi:hypothetical protein [Eisenbergiella massiliensis]|nr:hypothetical protein [Eisenbergiella massiliensis]